MKLLIILGFCLAVALALPAPDQPDDDDQEQQSRRKLNSVRLQKPTNQPGHSPTAQRSYYGQSYDLGSLSFRYYSPYYYGAYRPPYSYDTGDYNKYYNNNRYYKGQTYGAYDTYGTYDKAAYRPNYGNTGYGYDGQTYGAYDTYGTYDRAAYRPNYGNTGYRYDGLGYTTTYYNQGYAHQPYLRGHDDDGDSQR